MEQDREQTASTKLLFFNQTPASSDPWFLTPALDDFPS